MFLLAHAPLLDSLRVRYETGGEALLFDSYAGIQDAREIMKKHVAECIPLKIKAQYRGW